MGPKDAPCEHPSPAKTSAPAPSAFIFPPRRSHFPRIPFGDAHEDFGLPQQQLSTMRYPRKSYPHRCSLPCAKRFRPRACARVYIIIVRPSAAPGSVRAAVGKRSRRCGPVSRAAERRVGKGEGKSGMPPRAVPRTFPAYGPVLARLRPSPRPLMGEVPCVLPASARLRPSPCRLCAESLCAKAEVHKAIPAPARAFSPRQPAYGRAPARLWAKCRAQRRKYTRPTPPLPVRSPRGNLSTAVPLPAYGRSAERRVGEGEGKGGRPLAQQPAPVRLPPRPRRLNGHPASADGRENDRMAHRRTTTPTHRTPRGNDTCTIRVP